MAHWIAENKVLVNEAKSIFAVQSGRPAKGVKILEIGPEFVELDNFFEEDVELFFFHNMIRYSVQLFIQNITKQGTTLFSVGENRQQKVERSKARIDIRNQKPVVAITNFTSDYEIAGQIEFNANKVERVAAGMRESLIKYFPVVQIYFFHEIMANARGKVIKESNKPFVIPDIKNPNDLDKQRDPTGELTKLFFKRILPFSRHSVENTVSDITIPILFQPGLSYGYLHVCTKNKIDARLVPQLEKIALKINANLLASKVFNAKNEAIQVVDISSQGIGVRFQNRKLTTIFKPGALLSYDLLLPAVKLRHCLAYVRNNNSVQGEIISGLEFTNMSQEEDFYIQTYIQNLGPGKD